MGKGELRLLCVASTIVLEGVRMPLSEAHCKDEQLLFLVMDSAMLDSGFPFWARCMHQYGGKTRFTRKRQLRGLFADAERDGRLKPAALGVRLIDNSASLTVHHGVEATCIHCGRETAVTVQHCESASTRTPGPGPPTPARQPRRSSTPPPTH